jgi:allantoin racemase
MRGKTMKIAVIGTGFRATGDDLPPREISEFAASGFETRLVEQRLPAFPMNQINRTLSEVATIEAGLNAAERGFDAIFINTVGDYGLASLRSALPIPVIGAGQATMHAAAQLGERFSIVTIWPESLRFIYTHLLRIYGMERHCVSVRCVAMDDELPSLGDTENFVTDMRQGERSQIDRIVAACDAAIRADGADTIMLGCTCMSPIARDIAARCRAPTLNPLTTGYKAAEMTLALGVSHSGLAYQRTGGAGLDQFRVMADAVIGLEDDEPSAAAAE